MRANIARAAQRLRTATARPWVRIALLAVLGFSVHLPALQGQFLWDDIFLARDNPFIKSPLLAGEAFRHNLFLDSAAVHYRPVQNLSYMVDYYLWNTDASGFHLTNILLHVIGALLLYQLLARLFRGGIWSQDTARPFSPELAAFLIAAVWVVHPVHSAAVDYISGRADSLAFVFAAGGWLLFLRGKERSPRWFSFVFYSLAGGCGLLALCSREIACIWLLLFLAHTIFFAGDETRSRKIGAAVCCIAVLGLYLNLRHLPGGNHAEMGAPNWGAPIRATLMLRALGDYTRLLFWPANLHMERTVFDPGAFYDRANWRNAAPLEYLSILGLFAAAAAIFACSRHGPGRTMRVFGALWFFAAYLPISNIVLLNATVAEHWLYLPSVGAFIFLAGCLVELPEKSLRLIGPVLALAVMALAVRSTIRSSDWRDSEIFFTRTAAAGGRSQRLMVNLAQSFAERGQYGKAEAIYRRILELDPHYTIARNNLGCAFSREGKMADAENLFAQSSREALLYARGYSHSWLGAHNYANLRHAAHDDVAAVAALEQARAEYPDVWELISLESEFLRESKGAEAALPVVHDFAQRHPWHHAARLAEGRLYTQQNDVAQAEQALRAAARLDVHDVEALNLLARIYLSENRLSEARAIQLRAVARQPDKPTEYCLLAVILQKMGNDDEAVRTMRKVSQMRAMATGVPGVVMLAN